jgi:hypothetical protein
MEEWPKQTRANGSGRTKSDRVLLFARTQDRQLDIAEEAVALLAAQVPARQSTGEPQPRRGGQIPGAQRTIQTGGVGDLAVGTKGDSGNRSNVAAQPRPDRLLSR